MRLGRLAFHLVVLGALAAPPALAAEGPLGIGFAQAEEGTWWCHRKTVGEALDCARQQCLAESDAQECHATRWCFPAGTSTLMVVWLPEFHNTQVLCGMPGEAAAIAAMKAICEAGTEFSRCDLVMHIDPDGNETAVSGTFWPGGAALGTPDAEVD